MSFLNSILLWLHLGSLGLAGAATFGLPVVGAQLARAEPAGRAALGAVAMQITKLANLALAGLLVTGPIMVGTKFGGLGKLPDPAWFWAKMVLVVVLLGVIHMGRANAKKAMGGDGTAAARQPKFALAGIVVYLSVILCAVVSFG